MKRIRPHPSAHQNKRRSVRLIKKNAGGQKYCTNSEIEAYFVTVWNEMDSSFPSVRLPQVLIDLIYEYYKRKLDMNRMGKIKEIQISTTGLERIYFYSENRMIVRYWPMDATTTEYLIWQAPETRNEETECGSKKRKKRNPVRLNQWEKIHSLRVPLVTLKAIAKRELYTYHVPSKILQTYSLETLNLLESIPCPHVFSQDMKIVKLMIVKEGHIAFVTRCKDNVEVIFFDCDKKRVTNTLSLRCLVRRFSLTFLHCKNFILLRTTHVNGGAQIWNVTERKCVASWKSEMEAYCILGFMELFTLPFCLGLFLYSSLKKQYFLFFWYYQRFPHVISNENDFLTSWQPMQDAQTMTTFIGTLQEDYLVFETHKSIATLKLTKRLLIYYWNGSELILVRKSIMKNKTPLLSTHMNRAHTKLLFTFTGNGVEVWGS